MRKVMVAGVGMIPFAKPGGSEPYPVMGAAAARAALADAGIDYEAIQQAYAGYVYGDSTSGQRALYEVGLTGIPVINVNNNCSTGSTALFLARQAVESGAVDCALALGFEQMAPGALGTHFNDRPTPFDRFEAETEALVGMPDVPLALRYFGGAGIEHMRRYGTRMETFAQIRAKASRHAARNPLALFRREVTADEVMASPVMIPGVMTRLMACPPTCGAAAAVLMSEDFAAAHGRDAAVWIAAQAMTTDIAVDLRIARHDAGGRLRHEPRGGATDLRGRRNRPRGRRRGRAARLLRAERTAFLRSAGPVRRRRRRAVRGRRRQHLWRPRSDQSVGRPAVQGPSAGRDRASRNATSSCSSCAAARRSARSTARASVCSTTWGSAAPASPRFIAAPDRASAAARPAARRGVDSGPHHAPPFSRSLMALPVPRWMNPELTLFRDEVRRFVAREFVPHEARWETAQHVDRDAWTKAGAMGLLLCDIPEAYGGSGGSFAHECVVFEELTYANVTSFGKSVHSIVAHYVLAYGTEAQKQRWLPKMASGEWIAAIAMSEPSAGSDLRGIRTRARRDGDAYVVDGSKTFITNGHMADLICLVCKTDPDAGSKGISLLMVETGDLPGFRRGRILDKIGQKGQDTAELFFDGARVPTAHLLGGEEGRGLHQLMESLPWERTILAVAAVAAIELAVELTVAYAKEREAFGQKLIDMQNTRFRLAECKTQAHVARAFIDDCIERMQAGTMDTATASMAKWWTTDMQCKVVDECLQLFGGYGYMREYPIAKMYADARVQRIYGGTNEIMKELIARSL